MRHLPEPITLIFASADAFRLENVSSDYKVLLGTVSLFFVLRFLQLTLLMEDTHLLNFPSYLSSLPKSCRIQHSKLARNIL